jgi:hypothetical protein
MNDNETLGTPLDLKGRKICIGFPSPDHISVDFHNAMMQLVTQTSQFVPLGLTNSNSSRIAANRNAIVKSARELGATDILWIDSDSTYPVHSLVKLLMHDKDIVCATTCRRKGNDRSPIAVPFDMSSITQNQVLVKMRQIGFPFMLTKMKVFDKLDEMEVTQGGCYFAEPPRWLMRKVGMEVEGTEPLIGEDEYFCNLVINAGFDIWCDMELSMEIGHIGSTVFYIQQPDIHKSSNVDIKL